MAEAKYNYSGGDKVDATDLNENAKNTNDGMGARDTILMGETFTGATTPQPAYIDTSDNKLNLCDANDLDRLLFAGFVLNSGNDTDAAEFQGEGIVRGFTGLTEGVKYYVQDSVGVIGTTPGTYNILVGIAINATEILILKGNGGRAFIPSAKVSGSNTFDAGADTHTIATINCGFRPKLIKVWGIVKSVDVTGDAVHETAITGGEAPGLYSPAFWYNGDVYFGYNVSSGEVITDITTGLISTDNGFGETANLTIENVTSIGFDFLLTKPSGDAADFYWNFFYEAVE